jgi:hypothetical protein
MIEYIALFLIWFIFVPITIMLISNNSSKIGFYHISRFSEKIPTLNTIYSTKFLNPGDKSEPFFDKFIEVATSNCKLSAPFIFAFYSIAISSNLSQTIDVKDSIVLAFTLTIIVLMLMRFLSNPTDHFFKPILMSLITHPDKDEKTRLENYVIKDHKERMISFFFSFFCAAIIVSLILVSYDMLSGTNTTIASYLSLTQNPDISSLFIKILPIYVIVLLILTFIGELILFFLKPLRQFPIEKNEWSNPPE